MRTNNQPKRYQNRGRSGSNGRSGTRAPNRNTSFESHGPHARIRGTAQQLCEKYQQYARDAASNNDFVLRENCLQHAEHYYRMFGPSEDEAGAGASENFEEGGESYASSDRGSYPKRRRRWEMSDSQDNRSDRGSERFLSTFR